MTTTKSKILIIDDDATVCSSLTLILSKKGFQIQTVHSPQVALEHVFDFDPDLILLDMNFTIDTSGKQGLKMLNMILQAFPTQDVLLMTGWATVQLAVEGMKMGAKDFIAKPWDNNHLLSSIYTILDLKSPKETDRDITEPFDTIIGESEALLDVVALASRVARTDASVLILGESGTGKELIAEAIHQLSKRSEESFIKVNLGGISTSLFESEMFGHKKGAFTDANSDRVGRFEMAHKGTIFLDEIGELPASSQVKLLRVLQEKTFETLGSSQSKKSDFRVISATNKDLESMVIEGTFREDLFYRINLITIYLPALRDRREDIQKLVRHFIKTTSKSYDLQPPSVNDEGLKWLTNQDYPGNVRQLKNLIERAVLLNSDKKELTIKDFQHVLSQSTSSNSGLTLPNVGTMSLEEIEKRMIIKTLDYHHHSISSTSKSLGITRSSLYRRLEKYNIPYEPKI